MLELLLAQQLEIIQEASFSQPDKLEIQQIDNLILLSFYTICLLMKFAVFLPNGEVFRFLNTRFLPCTSKSLLSLGENVS